MEPPVVWYLGEESLHEAVSPTYPPISASPSFDSVAGGSVQPLESRLGWASS